jgi:hypothetical protein
MSLFLLDAGNNTHNVLLRYDSIEFVDYIEKAVFTTMEEHYLIIKVKLRVFLNGNLSVSSDSETASAEYGDSNTNAQTHYV